MHKCVISLTNEDKLVYICGDVNDPQYDISLSNAIIFPDKKEAYRYMAFYVDQKNTQATEYNIIPYSVACDVIS